jgi:hypothetical protein
LKIPGCSECDDLDQCKVCSPIGYLLNNGSCNCDSLEGFSRDKPADSCKCVGDSHAIDAHPSNAGKFNFTK